MFDNAERRKIIDSFLANGPRVNGAATYGVKIRPVQLSGVQEYAICLGTWHLPPEDNGGKHNTYIDVLDAEGNITHSKYQIDWDWEGRGYKERKPGNALLDKPENEASGNFALDSVNVEAMCHVANMSSDEVYGLTTKHADEGAGNTIGHHSFYVVFQIVTASAPPTPPPDTPPPDVPPSEAKDKLKVALFAAIAAIEDARDAFNALP